MRYIWNKQKLLEEIKQLLLRKNIYTSWLSFCDAFSWTWNVGNHFKDMFKIIWNDALYCSYVVTEAKLNPINKKFSKLWINPFDYFNDPNISKKWFVYKNYTPWGSERKYFSKENGWKIDFIRSTIDEWYNKKKISKQEKIYLIACLLESLWRVANIAWVYGSYLKIRDPRAIKPMKFIEINYFEKNNVEKNITFNLTIQQLIKKISWNILYLDPPYTKNQYATQYHILETIALYDNPEIFWKTWHRNVINQSSKFSKLWPVHIQFQDLIRNANFEHIILSYSSKWIMSKQFIKHTLTRYSEKGSYSIKQIPYKRYLNSKTENNTEVQHYEYLFYIKKDTKKQITYKSPLNYIGWKYPMVDFIHEHKPKQELNKVIDLFGWWCNVWINLWIKKVVYNEINFKVKEMIQMFAQIDPLELYTYLSKMIKKHKLEKNNKSSFETVRSIYNSYPETKRDPKLLYLLILYWFNQQIRFNSKLEFNNTVWESSFNDRILENMISYMNHLKTLNISFSSKDFEELLPLMDTKSFVYIDPPYLITCGSYNDGKRWFNGRNEAEERRLLSFLDTLHTKNIPWMLSNIFEKWEKKNQILIDRVTKNEFNVIPFDKKEKKGRKEIIITNY